MSRLRVKNETFYGVFEYTHDPFYGVLTVYEANKDKPLMTLSLYTAINNDTEVTLFDKEVPLAFIKHFDELLRKIEKEFSSDNLK